MKDKIKEAARKYINLKDNFDEEEERYYNSNNMSKYDAFIIGAESPEAKEYWQQGMYTDDEVCILLSKWTNVILDWFDSVLDGDKPTKPNLLEWFEQNKKK